jgi:signal-induced proliferation-associated 1 like protein 1
MQAVEYYTSTPQQALQSPGRPPQQQQLQEVSRPRGGASLTPTSSRGRFSGVRASYNERMTTRYQPHHHHHHPVAASSATSPSVVDLMYRSNSSLELEGEGGPDLSSVSSMTARREYGSHGSIDVLGDGPSPGGGSFFALLQDFKHRAAPPDQRSPGPARIADVLRGKLESPPASENATNALQATSGAVTTTSNGSNDSLEPDAASPKLRNKLHKFWGEKAGKQGKNEEQPPSLFRKLRGRSQQAEDAPDCGLTSAGTSDEERERQRRRAFAHYDCQSVTANLPSAASRLRSLLLLRRRNTATGASAASMRASTPDAPLSNGSSEHLEEDAGDGRSNELVERYGILVQYLITIADFETFVVLCFI